MCEEVGARDIVLVDYATDPTPRSYKINGAIRAVADTRARLLNPASADEFVRIDDFANLATSTASAPAARSASRVAASSSCSPRGPQPADAIIDRQDPFYVRFGVHHRYQAKTTTGKELGALGQRRSRPQRRERL